MPRGMVRLPLFVMTRGERLATACSRQGTPPESGGDAAQGEVSSVCYEASEKRQRSGCPAAWCAATEQTVGRDRRLARRRWRLCLPAGRFPGDGWRKFMIVRVLVLLVLAGMLCGCGARPVTLVDEKGFVEMSRRMPKEMQARQLLTDDGAYVQRLSGSSVTYGELLYTTLSPDFLFDDTGGQHVYLGETFRDTRTPSSFVHTSATGFTIQHPTQRITLRMLAILDWDDDGQDEWMLSCKVEPLRGSRVRTYYVLVTPPSRSGQRLKGTVAALCECYGLVCNTYVNKARVLDRNGNDKSAPATPVQDSVPGLEQVTEPPRVPAPAAQGKDVTTESGLVERSL